MNLPVLFVCRKKKEDDKVSRAKNPKYESMSLEKLKANMEKSRQELEAAIHHKNILEQRKKLVERQQIPCPSWWHRKRGLRTYYTKWEKKDPENGKYVWDESYLKSLRMNPVYCGDMASQKRYYRFKIGSQGDKAPEDWMHSLSSGLRISANI